MDGRRAGYRLARAVGAAGAAVGPAQPDGSDGRGRGGAGGTGRDGRVAGGPDLGECCLVEGLFRANPTDARIAHEVPRTLGNMAIALERAGRQNEALAAHDRAHEVLGMIGDANPTLLSVTRDRTWIDVMTARILIGTARDAEALPVSSGPVRPVRPW